MLSFFIHSCALLVIASVIRVTRSKLIVVIDRHIMPHYKTIVSGGRQIQNTLHLPEILCVFADVEPGMRRAGVRDAIEFALLASTFIPVVLLAAFMAGRFWRLLVYCISFCVVRSSVRWIQLIFEKRQLLSEGWNEQKETEDSLEELQKRDSQNSVNTFVGTLILTQLAWSSL
ncbi:uncharacterized protein GGS22DRAFT_157434 [Annulohypoxylon maeteangense]|uniref:uncharacterized protein n=1 Tax=Annulohypoxylon maeteangense TaxID=1927788 RepID=UPI002007A164|nr:uncharacterized protein GGS22DRAFT_157434 [Annulohypoxylon maeteangense]KAI0887546.1 hypothetical protein GGS22DRAFT_157434 [Annulohypoxylon maeteangense]